MGKIGTIIFLVIVVWQVVNSILEQSSKKKQGQQAKELQLQRQRQIAARRQSPSGAGGTTTARTPAALQSKDVSRAETLAERRKAQLEELRRRRQDRAGATARIGTPPPARTQTQVRVGPTAPTPMLPTPFPAPTAPVDIDSWRARQEAEHLREAAAKQQLQQQRVIEQARLVREQRRKGPRRQLAETHDLYDTPAPRPEFASEIRRQLHGTRSLRQLFLLKEMIDPPLALRSDPGGR